jgi:ABC-type branched-subunit amino acid transport system ATPase component
MAQLADEAVVINRGRLVRQGAIAELTEGRSLEDAFLALTGEEGER